MTKPIENDATIGQTHAPATSGTAEDAILDRLDQITAKVDWIAAHLGHLQSAASPGPVRPLPPIARPAPPDPRVRPTPATPLPVGALPSVGHTQAPRGDQQPATPAPVPGWVPAGLAAAQARLPHPTPSGRPLPTAPRAAAGTATPAPGQPSTSGPSEATVGKYLLSFAAAILVLLAGASLILLAWNQVPDPVKVGAVGGIGLVFTTAGTLLARGATHRVAAGTLMGTGGGLGFVAIVGAVLLDAMLPLPVAFALLTVWAVVLVVLAARTRTVLTTVMAAVGGVVTLGLAASHAAHHPDQAASSLVMMATYVVVLSATTGVTAGTSTPPRLRPWHLTSSLAVTGLGLILAPLGPARDISEILGLLSLVVLIVTLVTHLVAITATLPPQCAGLHPAAPVMWAGGGLVLVAPLARLVGGDGARQVPEAASTAVTLAVILAVMALAALVAVRLPLSGAARIAVSLGTFGLICLVAIMSFAQPDHLAWLVLIAMAAAAATAPAALTAGSSTHLLLLPALGVLLALPLIDVRTSDRVAALLLTVTAAAAPLTVEGTLRGRGTGKNGVRLTVAAWAVAAILTVGLPVQVTSLVDSLGVDGSWSSWVWATVTCLVLVLLIALGLATGPDSPRDLLGGHWWGVRLGPVEPAPGGDSAGSSVPGVTVAVVLLADLALVLTTAVMISSADPLAQTLTVPAVLALTGAVIWVLRPVMTVSAGGLLTGLTVTLAVLVVPALLLGAGLLSIPTTAALLAAGAVMVVAGFRIEARTARTYGLALVMVMVLKLATVDMTGQNSVVRIVALAAAGAICFGLSLSYSRYAALLDHGCGKPSSEATGTVGPWATPPVRPSGAPGPR